MGRLESDERNQRLASNDPRFAGRAEGGRVTTMAKYTKQLAAAAKAVGAEMTDYSDRTPDHWKIEKEPNWWVEWDPLASDGDAMRIAVKLGLNVHVDIARGYTSVSYSDGVWHALSSIEHGGDACSATRHAIVTVAEAIGEKMNIDAAIANWNSRYGAGGGQP